MCGNADEFLCHIARYKLGERILVYITKLPFVKNVKVAGENASVAFNYRVTGANACHSAILGRSAETHTYVVVEIADADRMTRAEILVIFVESYFKELRVAFLSQRIDLLFTVKRVKAGNELNESIALE